MQFPLWTSSYSDAFDPVIAAQMPVPQCIHPLRVGGGTRKPAGGVEPDLLTMRRVRRKSHPFTPTTQWTEGARNTKNAQMACTSGHRACADACSALADSQGIFNRSSSRRSNRSPLWLGRPCHH